MHTRLSAATMIAISGLLVSLQAYPALGAQARAAGGNALLTHLSQAVTLRYWLAHPTEAPAPLQERFRRLTAAVSNAPGRPALAAEVPALFNQDSLGLP